MKVRHTFTGFSLVEVILYMALLTIMITGVITFAWNLLYGQQKAVVTQVVDDEAAFLSARVANVIATATKVTASSATSITLNTPNGSTVLSINSGQLTINTGAGTQVLSSNLVTVLVPPEVSTNPFTVSTVGDQSTVSYAFTITDSNAGGVQLAAQKSVAGTVSVGGAFSTARTLLVDASVPALVNTNTRISGLTLQNVASSSALTITSMSVSWGATAASVTAIQIDGGAVEFSGTAANGAAINTADYTLTVAAGAVPLNYIDFSSSMAGETVTITFTLSDASTQNTVLTFNATATPSPSVSPSPTVVPTPTPTPTPSPSPSPSASPITTCAQYCASLGTYTTGTCRRNAAACNALGETQKNGGNIYCPGTGNQNVCCCL